MKLIEVKVIGLEPRQGPRQFGLRAGCTALPCLASQEHLIAVGARARGLTVLPHCHRSARHRSS